MEQLPAAWAGRGDEVDEIWAPTRFIATALRAAFTKPVYTMLPGLELSPFDPLPKEYFGLSGDRYVFAFVFDMNSRMQRKNPLGLIRAFREAFRRDEPVDLVIKVSPPESFYKDQWDELRQAVDAAGVTLIDRVLTRQELLAFLHAADCYVSLHRSEGFGLTCAEAMLLGKPVVATAYSGNLDFMNPDNSYLVNYDRVTLTEDIDPYPRGAVWADPHIDHAAQQMRRVYDQREEAVAKGRQAQAEVSQLLSLEAAGRRMAERLEAIRRSKMLPNNTLRRK
jgi:glycosyltransferase involved in cell wall biosynthesis